MRPIKHRHQLMDAFWEIQDNKGYIADADIASLAAQLGISKIDVEGVLTFYHFFERQPPAKYTIYLNNSIVAKFSGFNKVKTAFEQATGTVFGQHTKDGMFALRETSCIGLSDMEPAALINWRPFVELTPQKVHQLIVDLRAGENLDELSDEAVTKVRHRLEGDKAVFLRTHLMGAALRQLPFLSPEDIVKEIKEGHLTGMGGAFFPTHIKWEGCRQQPPGPKYVVCNADEGEPGTFKDRYLLRHYPGLILEGMIIGGYAVGAQEGIIYLRAEYFYLKDKIEKVIKDYRRQGWLGKNVLGIDGFNFDIRIQMGAGSYVCGAETALLQSMEGYRGEPRPRAYLPIEKGFLGKPTIVNNVETYCQAARILELGSDHILNTGTKASPGTKLVSVSGDCSRPGIYEIEWGTTIQQLLTLCGAADTMAVSVSGPSGDLISAKEFDREIALNDLRCGGSFMIFNSDRNLLEIILNYNEFFVNESCGVCTPCRAGNFILQRQLRKISRGLLDHSDFERIQKWSKIMKSSTRCGLGMTAPNPILQSIEKFPDFFEQYLAPDTGLNTSFELDVAVKEYDSIIQKQQQL